MKKIFLFFILISFGAKAQISLEQTYDSAGTYNVFQGRISQLVLVKFEVSGERYIKINPSGGHIKLYSLNHSLLKTIDISGLPHGPNSWGSFIYFSEKLFNTDNKMEYMYVAPTASLATHIYNEDGVLVFTDPGFPYVLPNVHQLQYPIYNTSQGTKLLLSYTNGQAKVFSLAGTLNTNVASVNEQLFDNSDLVLSNPTPNPVSDQTYITYVLPQGVLEGEIVLYDLQGKEVNRFRVDNTFNNLALSASEIPSGTYL